MVKKLRLTKEREEALNIIKANNKPMSRTVFVNEDNKEITYVAAAKDLST